MFPGTNLDMLHPTLFTTTVKPSVERQPLLIYGNSGDNKMSCDRGNVKSLVVPTAAYAGTKYVIDNVLNTTSKINESNMEVVATAGIFAITSFIYDYLYTMKGMQNIILKDTCSKCLLRNVVIIVAELIYDYYKYRMIPNITVILSEVVSVFTAELVEKNIPMKM